MQAVKSTVDSVVSASAAIQKRAGKDVAEFELPFSKMPFAPDATALPSAESLLACMISSVRQRETLLRTCLRAGEERVYGGLTFLNLCLRLCMQGEESAAQSPFEALAGRADSMGGWTLEELGDALRRDVVLQADVSSAAVDLREFEVPRFDAQTGSSVVWRLSSVNCYLLDLWSHGKLVRAVKETGVAPENLWYLLLHFVSAIDYVRRSLLEIAPQKAGSPLEGCLNALGHRMSEVFKHQSA